MIGTRPRVLICEDSKTYAAALARVVEHGGDLELVGVARTAEEAIAALPRLRPDVITIDLELPGMSGLEAVEQIMSAAPLPILVLSSLARAGSAQAAAALAAGALDALSKDDLPLADPDATAASSFRRRLALLSGVRVIHHPRARIQRLGTRPRTRSARAIGVCASTGGPAALVTVLSSLPVGFPVPVLVAQHVAAGFADGLAQWLRSSLELPVRVAADGVRAEPGVWLAPEGAHLLLDAGGRVRLDDRTPAGPYVPSGDVLLRSLARSVGRDAVAVVLTGMGRDGAEGAEAVRAAGGLAIAQDEASSVVFGMPKAAAERGVDVVLPLSAIGGELAALQPDPVAA
jgi:two-component system, chemotaxis family, protein-glutamate methylesterase/glutaminase